MHLTTLAVVFSAFVALYYFIAYQKQVRAQMVADGVQNISTNKTTLLLSAVVSIIINGYNYILVALCKQFTKFERQPTKTWFNISAIKKMTYSQAMVTVLLIFVIQVFLQDNVTRFNTTFGPGGLSQNAIIVVLGTTFIPFFVEAFNVDGIVRNIKRWLYVYR